MAEITEPIVKSPSRNVFRWVTPWKMFGSIATVVRRGREVTKNSQAIKNGRKKGFYQITPSRFKVITTVEVRANTTCRHKTPWLEANLSILGWSKITIFNRFLTKTDNFSINILDIWVNNDSFLKRTPLAFGFIILFKQEFNKEPNEQIVFECLSKSRNQRFFNF